LRITILAVGRAKAGPETALYDHFVRRIAWPVTLREVEEKRQLPAAQRIAREGVLLSEAAPAGARIVALDERGALQSSEEFAGLLGQWRDQGTQDVCFMIGGADGHAEPIRARADLLLALGRMTWPHLVVRGLLAEQLYRAQTILSGHPYHRS
jgi:23S rRNA (pseudouridine1915-N3)-methyltransferase